MSGVLGTQAYKQYFGYPKSYRQGAITASMPAGSLVGSIMSSFLADRYSRKVALQISCILWIIGATIQTASQNVGMLCTGRVIAGLCVGIASAVVPVYQVGLLRLREWNWDSDSCSLKLLRERSEDESSGKHTHYSPHANADPW